MSLLLFRWWLTLTGTVQDRVDAARTDERGLTTTEWALLTAGAAAIAIIVIAIVKAKASDAGNNIPTSP
jgi:hypothetical protein